MTFERFGYVIGRQGVINVTVHANPKPEFTWRIDDERIHAGYTDQSNRFQSSSPVELVSFFFFFKLNFIKTRLIFKYIHLR
jgi:hypothetical protein